MSVCLLLVVTGALIGVFESVQQAQGYVSDRSHTLDGMRLTMDRVPKELRQGSSVAWSSNASVLDLMAFTKGQPIHVVYRASGVTLTRTVGTGSAVVIQDGLTTTGIFGYEPSPSDPQIVTVTLSVQPKKRPNTTLVLSSEVSPRNRGLT